MIKIYGIKNCDTMKKAFNWLNENDVEYEFIDYKKQNPKSEDLKTWCEKVGWETLLNTRGTTWRKIDPSKKNNLDAKKVIDLLVENPSAIKRPVIIDLRGNVIVGLDLERYEQTLTT
jgi:arsenate reductase